MRWGGGGGGGQEENDLTYLRREDDNVHTLSGSRPARSFSRATRKMPRSL